jgi:ribosome-associated translation inhibitor RaiA
MAEKPTVVISFKDLETDEELRETIETRAHALAAEFPETTRVEVTLAAEGAGHVSHVGVHGRSTQIDVHASAIEKELAVDRALEKLARALRREHDKRIFARRREAQKANPKRGSS